LNAGNTLGRKAAIAVFAALLLFAIALMFNQPGGPVTEASGIVQTFAFIPSDAGAPTQVASVQLTDGIVVQAQVQQGVLVQPGQVAKLLVYRRVITGTPSYELVGTERNIKIQP
jgi:hypothetical protein